MSQDNSEQYSDQQESSGEELNTAIAGSEENIVVTEEKQPINRGTLMMFAVLVLGAAGMFVMYRHSGPKSASAAVNKETAEARKTISTFLSGGEDNFKSMEERLKNTEKVVQQFAKYPSATQVPLADLTTNPFRQHSAEQKKDDSANLSEAAEKAKREQERLAIKKAAEGLQVQSIVYNQDRQGCMINNTICREGQAINDFTVEKITPTSVIVKNGPYRFELKMQR
jgi:hypothetical protein